MTRLTVTFIIAFALITTSTLQADQSATRTADGAVPDTADTGEAGLVAYLENHYQEALRLWRGMADSGRADGVLLYQYAYALEESGAGSGEVRAIRRRARKTLERDRDGGWGPVECYYFTALGDDEEEARLREECFVRFQELSTSDDPVALYFLSRLADDNEQRVEEHRSLLGSAFRQATAAGAHPTPWLPSIARTLGLSLSAEGRHQEGLDTIAEGLARAPGHPALLQARADILWDGSRYAEAAAANRAILEIRPDAGTVWTNLGFALWAQDLHAEGLEAFDRAILLGDDSANARQGAGLCLLAIDRPAEAADRFRESIRRDRDWARPHYNLARALVEMKDPDAAEKAARIAIHLEPDEWDFYSLLGEIHAGRNDDERALAVYREAIDAKATPADAFAAIGSLQLRLGRGEEAIAALRQTIAIDPGNGRRHRELGDAQEKLGHLDDAESSYREAIKLEPDVAVHHGYLGSLLEDSGRTDESLATYARAEELSADYAFAVERTAILLGSDRGTPEAIAYLEARLERFSDDASILRRAGIAYHAAKRLDDAERILRRATAAAPRSELALDSLALVLNAAGRREDGIGVLQQGLEAMPDSAQIHFRLGSFLDTTDRPQEAVSHLLAATISSPGFATAWNSLGAVYSHLDRKDEAIAAFQRAIALRDGFTLARLNLARTHRLLGRHAESIDAFRAALAEDGSDPDIWSLLTEQLYIAKRLDEADETLERGFELDPRHPGLNNLRADLLQARGMETEALAAFQTAQEVAQENDYPFRREAEILHARHDYAREIERVEAWIARFPKSGQAHRQRGLAYLQMKRYEPSAGSFRAALDLSVDDWIAWAGLGDSAFHRENWEAAREAYGRAASLKPDSAPVRGQLGAVLRRLDRVPEAIDSYREALRLDPRADFRVALAELLRDAGRKDEAVALLQAGLGDASATGRTPAELSTLRRALADLFQATGRPVRAIPLLEQEITASPRDLKPRRDLANALRGAGRLETCARTLEEILRIDADDQEALAMLRALPKGVADVETFLRSVRPAPLAIAPVDTAASLARYRPDDPVIAAVLRDAPIVGLEDQMQVQVREGGLLTRTMHQILRPLDQAGAEALGEYRIAWAPEREQLEVHKARTHLPDGRIVDADPGSYHHVSPSDTSTSNVYSDSEILVISLPQVQPGAAIEVEFTKKMKSTLTDRNWWVGWIFQGANPYLRSRLVVRAPRDATIRYDAIGEAPEPEEHDDGEQRVLTWTADNLPGLRGETASPPLDDLRAAVRVSSYNSWDEIASWYQGLVRDRYDFDPAERAAVMDIIAGADDPVERARRLYHHLQRTVRYVSVSLGIGSYQPHKASETLHNQFGDCKDRGTLLIAMLGAAGIRALPALVRTRDQGSIVHAASDPGQFNHFIVYLPDVALSEGTETAAGDAATRGLFIDATTENTDLGILPDVTQGVEAFIIEEGRGRFLRTPVSIASMNRIQLDRSIEIGVERTARIVDDATMHGSFASRSRNYLAGMSSQGRRDLVVDSVREEFPSAAGIEFTFTGFDGPGQPPRDYETYQVPGFARKVGSAWVMNLDLGDHIRNQVPAPPASERRLDYHADVPLTLVERTVLKLVGDRRFTDWPAPVHLESDVARFDLSFTPGQHPGDRGAKDTGASLTIEMRFVLRERIVPLAAYAGLAELVERALSACSVTLLAR